jgi:small subunit ribosomal protein S14
VAKKSMIAREERRRATAAQYQQKRLKLKALIQSPLTDEEARFAALLQLQRLPRDASPCRGRKRCSVTGRPHGVYRKFGLGRNKLREAVMRGDVPGVVKASW